MKKWHLPFLLFLIAGSIWVVKNDNITHGRKMFYNEEHTIFGTVMHVTYEADSSFSAGYMEQLAEVDRNLSMFNKESLISKINREETDSLSEMLNEVLTMALSISQATDGAFDVTVAPLVNAWGFGFKNDVLPDSTQVDSLRALVGYKNISITKDGRVRKLIPGIIMDFSAIAKGYGVDKVAEYLKEKGVKNLMVEIGGEVVVCGKNPKGKEWRIGLNKPVDDPTSTNREIEKVIELSDGAMATSGNYRNFYMTKDGRRIMHTIDPKTGYPVQHSILSSTVYAPTCAMADAFATAFMVMGEERAKKVLSKHPELKVDFITCTQK